MSMSFEALKEAWDAMRPAFTKEHDKVLREGIISLLEEISLGVALRLSKAKEKRYQSLLDGHRGLTLMCPVDLGPVTIGDRVFTVTFLDKLRITGWTSSTTMVQTQLTLIEKPGDAPLFIEVDFKAGYMSQLDLGEISTSPRENF